jgi:hypothetical protein
MNGARAYARLVLVLAAPLALSGCSAVRLAYNNADWLLRREIAKFSCPGEQQQAWLKQQIEGLHAWHRRQELPRYARTLRRLAAGLDRPLTRDWLEDVYGAVEDAVMRFVKRVQAPTVAYVSELKPSQVGCMARSMSKRWEQNKRLFQKPHAVYVELQREKWEDRLDDWMGGFTPGQRAELDRRLTARKPIHRQMTTAWRNSGVRFLVLMVSKEPPQEHRRRLQKVMTRRYALYTSAERRLAGRWERANKQVTWAIASRMTADQRSRLKRSVLGLARDLDILSGR